MRLLGSMMEGHRLLIILNSSYRQLVSTSYRDRFTTRTQEHLLNKWKQEIDSSGTYTWCYALHVIEMSLLPSPGFCPYLGRGRRDDEGSVYLQSPTNVYGILPVC